MQITTIGLDIAKRSFQIHGIDKTGAVVVAKALSRGRVLVFFSKLEPCLIGLEACASAHYWGRELGALGHQVHLIPPAYVKAYLRRNKNDAADAAAICEAVSRPHMRFVEVKSAAKQAARSLTRVREQLISQRTATVNSLRGHLAEFGIIEAAGLARARRLRAVIEDGTDRRLPDLARESLSILVEQIEDLDGKILDLDGRIPNAEPVAEEGSLGKQFLPGSRLESFQIQQPARRSQQALVAANGAGRSQNGIVQDHRGNGGAADRHHFAGADRRSARNAY